MNFTMPPVLIVVDAGEYEVVFPSLVVTVGTTPGGQETVRTLGAAPSIWDAASGLLELPLHAASGINKASEARKSIDTS